MQMAAPCLWFNGQAEAAARFYVQVFPNSQIDAVVGFGSETPGGKPGEIMAVEFTLDGRSFSALNGGPHVTHSPAVSFVVPCADQAEIDHYWAALGTGGTPQRCGWMTDRFGVSWQIVPERLFAMRRDPDPVKARRVTEAMLTMIKLDVPALEAAFAGD